MRAHRQGFRATVLAALAAASASALMFGPAAPAEVRSIEGIHDARYCEFFEVRGALPEVRVIVWNTIGLNDCPPRKWAGLDTAALAQERGSALILRNGPRHFLMDAAEARTGRVDSFDGLRMRKVATIPISGPGDFARAPYEERTIGRTNDWRWKKGRRVFELLAPGGAAYVMQSYSQEIDPSQEIGDLRSLGRRLDLPEGWRYRVRRLERPLILAVRGEATILQDDLRNTYQRLP